MRADFFCVACLFVSCVARAERGGGITLLAAFYCWRMPCDDRSCTFLVLSVIEVLEARFG